MKYENKKFQVRRYSDFPHKKLMDVVVKTFNNFEDAKFYSIVKNKSLKKDQRGYYVIDSPHQDIYATPEQESAFEKAKRKCGLIE